MRVSLELPDSIASDPGYLKEALSRLVYSFTLPLTAGLFQTVLSA